MGPWLLQESVREWGSPALPPLLAAAAEVPPLANGGGAVAPAGPRAGGGPPPPPPVAGGGRGGPAAPLRGGPRLPRVPAARRHAGACRRVLRADRSAGPPPLRTREDGPLM